MTLNRAEDCAVFELPGIRFTSLASPRTGGEDNSIWRLSIAAGTPGMAHKLTRQEVIHALSGMAVATIGGRRISVEPGDTILVPPMTAFSLANQSEKVFEALVVFPKGGQAIMGEEAPFTPPWAA
jgi:mannose-6-phosphate isomerase-like protein (cupin superfamily)